MTTKSKQGNSRAVNSSSKSQIKAKPTLGTDPTKQQQQQVACKPPPIESPTSVSATTIITKNTTPATDWENLSKWNDASVAEVAVWWNLNQEKVAKLWELHDRLLDVTHWKNQPNEVVRYLRDAHFHVKPAEAKFRRMIEWRINEKVDEIVTDYQPPHPLMEDYIPTTVLEACDKQGDPIWLERVGAADSWGLLKRFGQPDLIRYAVYIREACIRGEWAQEYQRRNGGRPPARATAIIDLGGMSWEHCKPSLLPLLKEGLQIVQEYYCGFGKKVIVIRVSKLFPIVWKVAQHFCGENLKNMMVFATADNYLQVLEEYVELESLPPCLYKGGKGRGGVAMPNSLEGGKVPSWEELDRLWEQRQQNPPSEVVKPSGLPMSISNLTDECSLTEASSPTFSSRGEYYNNRHSNDEMDRSIGSVSAKVARLGGGVFDFSSDGKAKTVLTFR